MMDTEAITAALNSFLSEHSIENRRVFIRRYWRAANSNRWPLGEQDMENHAELINGLFEKNDKVAYKCLKELITESEKDACVYPFFDTFAEMIDNDNSYIRTRGLLLISANAKWDTDFKIDEIIDKYLRHIMDDKPITARQCIKALPNIAKFKPDLVDDIRSALNKSNPGRYADSMQSLIQNDIRAALKAIND